jgi:hypothetical protein
MHPRCRKSGCDIGSTRAPPAMRTARGTCAHAHAPRLSKLPGACTWTAVHRLAIAYVAKSGRISDCCLHARTARTHAQAHALRLDHRRFRGFAAFLMDLCIIGTRFCLDTRTPGATCAHRTWAAQRTAPGPPRSADRRSPIRPVSPSGLDWWFLLRTAPAAHPTAACTAWTTVRVWRAQPAPRSPAIRRSLWTHTHTHTHTRTHGHTGSRRR